MLVGVSRFEVLFSGCVLASEEVFIVCEVAVLVVEWVFGGLGGGSIGWAEVVSVEAVDSHHVSVLRSHVSLSSSVNS